MELKHVQVERVIKCLIEYQDSNMAYQIKLVLRSFVNIDFILLYVDIWNL